MLNNINQKLSHLEINFKIYPLNRLLLILNVRKCRKSRKRDLNILKIIKDFNIYSKYIIMTLPKNDIEKVEKFVNHLYRKLVDKHRCKTIAVQILKNRGYTDDNLIPLLQNDNTNWKSIIIHEETKNILDRMINICLYSKT